MIEGKVGSRKYIWNTIPKGQSGEAEVLLPSGKPERVKWIRDSQGVWIETSNGYFGYEVRKTHNDDGLAQYALIRRKHAGLIQGLSFLKAGEEVDVAGGARQKKGLKVKSQMPGKIIRILVKPGDDVKKGQALLVMEAMKMENEIKASQDGVIKDVKVAEGQAVETGAEMILFG